MRQHKYLLPLLAALLPAALLAQTADSLAVDSLASVTVTARRTGTTRLAGAVNGFQMNQDELFRAACCNLGESFVNNPSVDVSYSDATTGAKQIRLLGLSGTYVQMLTENLPAFRGSALTYALDYVPGPWMKSIQVSKGAASVRNGYEGITGQINVEYLKPEDEQGLTLNLYGNTLSRFEANADANLHLNTRLSTEILLHYQDDGGHHDINHDGFMDQPNTRQYNLQNRWYYLGSTYIFHGGVALLSEERDGGQIHPTSHTLPPFRISTGTDRYEAYMKHAFVLDRDHGTNLALMASGTLHQLDATYGIRRFSSDEKNLYAQLLFETHFTDQHELSAGLSLNHDRQQETLTPLATVPAASPAGSLLLPPLLLPPLATVPAASPAGSLLLPPLLLTPLAAVPAASPAGSLRETTPGAYAQYTFDWNSRLVAMAGLRLDHSSRYGTFLTPRLHLKYTPLNLLSLRLSAGKGYRTPHPLAENHFLLASGRGLTIASDLEQEAAWNYGLSAALTLPLGERLLKVNAEYFYTHFLRQMVIDYETPGTIFIHNLDGRSFSHTFQVDATYPAFDGFSLTAAYRLNDVRMTLGGRLREKPLTPRYKALLTASYKTPLELWQFDATLQLNGGGRLPQDYGHFSAYPQLSAQVTRWFRHWSLYVGGENLTGFRQKTPILGADDPWSPAFEPTLVWGPVHGALAYAGLRINIGKL